MGIVLVGYMGCGKSTVGKRLSEKTGMLLLDADKEIENKEKRTISEIFATEGEEYFRRLETEYLVTLKNSDMNFILSTGGGMPVREENRLLLKALGTVFYLKAGADTIYSHIKGDTTRPLLQCDDPLAKIKSMLVSREPYYMDAADAVIETDGKNINAVINEINEILNREGTRK